MVWPDTKEGVMVPGRQGVSSSRTEVGAAGCCLEELPDLPMTCHNKRE